MREVRLEATWHFQSRKKSGLVQAGLRQLSLFLPLFSLPSRSCSQAFVNTSILSEMMSVLWILYLDSMVCCHWLVLLGQIACDEALLNAESAWQTQLFLYVSLTRETGVELRHLLSLTLSNSWPSSFPLHFQPGNSFCYVASASSCWTSLLLFNLFHLTD